MNKYYLFLLLFSLLSCDDDRPACTSIHGPVRIIYLDSFGTNILEEGSLTITNIFFAESGDSLPYRLLDFVIEGSTEKFHLDLDVEELYYNCYEQNCNILFEFDNIEKMDTLSFEIYKSSSGNCRNDFTRTFTYNGTDYLNQQENTIGAYEILK
jgi:hypothetical protein